MITRFILTLSGFPASRRTVRRRPPFSSFFETVKYYLLPLHLTVYGCTVTVRPIACCRKEPNLWWVEWHRLLSLWREHRKPVEQNLNTPLTGHFPIVPKSTECYRNVNLILFCIFLCNLWKPISAVCLHAVLARPREVSVFSGG